MIPLSVSCRPYVLFANKRDIRLTEISPSRVGAGPLSKTTIVVKFLEDAAALDFILRDDKVSGSQGCHFYTNNPLSNAASLNGQVCWSEIKPQTIRCSEIDPKKKGRVKKETVAAQGVVKPEGVACDWVTKKVSAT